MSQLLISKVDRGTVRVKCLAQENNTDNVPSQGFIQSQRHFRTTRPLSLHMLCIFSPIIIIKKKIENKSNQIFTMETYPGHGQVSSSQMMQQQQCHMDLEVYRKRKKLISHILRYKAQFTIRPKSSQIYEQCCEHHKLIIGLTPYQVPIHPFHASSVLEYHVLQRTLLQCLQHHHSKLSIDKIYTEINLIIA